MASSSKVCVAIPKKVEPLAIIEPGNDSSSILVKVLRKWYVFSARGGNSPTTVEMVLADSEVYPKTYVLAENKMINI